MLIDRRKFLNFAAANTVAAAMPPIETEESNKQWPSKGATTFAFRHSRKNADTKICAGGDQ